MSNTKRPQKSGRRGAIKMESATKSYKNYIFEVLIIIFTIFVAFLMCFIQKRTVEEYIRNIIFACLGSGMIVLSVSNGLSKNSFSFSNNMHLERFFAVYLLSLVVTISTLFLPAKLWIMLPIALGFTLYSDLAISFTSYLTIMFMSVINQTTVDYGVYFGYFFSGMIIILLFQTLDQEYRVVKDLIMGIFMLMVSLTGAIVLFEEPVKIDQFSLVFMNCFLSFVISLILLKAYSYFIVHQYRDRYQELNDPEFMLLSSLRDHSLKDYYYAVHTAYFCDKVSRRINADTQLAKSGGYYQRIGLVTHQKESLDKEDIAQIGSQYLFPPDLIHLLEQCQINTKSIVTKEAAIVVLVSSVVSTIMYLFEKDPNASLNYQQIVDAVIKKKIATISLNNSQLSFQELQQIKLVLGEENLYYDFLRGRKSGV